MSRTSLVSSTGGRTRAAIAAASARVARLREALREHAALLATAFVVPAAVLAVDLVARWPQWRHFPAVHHGSFLVGAAIDFALWALLFETARHPTRAFRVAALALIAFTAAFGIGGQAYFRLLTNGYVDREVLLLATQFGGVVGGWMQANAVAFAAALALPAIVVALGAALRARHFGRRRRRPTALAAAALLVPAAAVFVPAFDDLSECMPPDMMFVHALGGPLLFWAHLAEPPRNLPPGKHEALPGLRPVDATAPSVVLLFGESVRRDRVCVPPSPGCPWSPALDAAAPNRVGYLRAFTLASCTELASAWLFTGLGATATGEEIARAPLLFDYAKARGYRTAYLASQHLGYGNLGLFVRSTRADRVREARDRGSQWSAATGSPDEVTTREALDFIRAPGGPAFVVVHFSNTHDPYREIPAYKRFATKVSFDPRDRKPAYENSLLAHDAVVGEFVKALRDDPRTKSAIVVYLSDHGEAWGEHGALGHGSDLFGEQIDVPLWIDAPEGSIGPEQAARLRRDAPVRPVPTTDLTATLVDLFGALDAPELAAATSRLGQSLLRDAPAARPPVLLWNCPAYRVCAFPAVAAVAWPMKYQWVGREDRYVCTDIEADPSELAELPPERCSELAALVRKAFASGDAGAPR